MNICSIEEEGRYGGPQRRTIEVAKKCGLETDVLYPIKEFRLPIEIQNRIILCSLFLLGAFFVHRSAALYIFLGIALNVLFWHSFIYNKKSC